MGTFQLRDKVCAFPKKKYDKEYIPEAQAKRHKYHTHIGVITDIGANGSLHVKFGPGAEAWYESAELVLVQTISNQKFTPYAWAADPAAIKKLEEHGFKNNVTCEGDIWRAAHSLFLSGINVMIKHGEEADILYVDSKGFGCR